MAVTVKMKKFEVFECQNMVFPAQIKIFLLIKILNGVRAEFLAKRKKK